MKRNQANPMSGYTLAEAMVVLAIISLISVASVPAFMNFMHTNQVRTSMRQFTSDLRRARQRAVTRDRFTRISFSTSAVPGTYQLFDGSADNAGNIVWSPTVVRTGKFEKDVYFYTDNTHPTFDDTVDANGAAGTDGKPDIIFRQNGTVLLAAAATPDVYIRTKFTNIAFDEYKVTFSATGNLTVTGQRY